LIKHNYFHGFDVSNCPGGLDQCHIDGVQTWSVPGGTNLVHDVTITGNVMFNMLDSLIARDTTSATYGSYSWLYNFTLTNNIYGYNPSAAGGGGQELANCPMLEHVGNVKFDFNTCLRGSLIATNGTQITSARGNIFPHTNLGSSEFGLSPGQYPLQIFSGSQVTEDHNLFHCDTCTISNWSNDLTNVLPQFVNEGGRDFHLQAGSPAIGAGPTSTGVTLDFDGVTRGSPPAIGPYEYGVATTSTPLPPTDLQVTVF
jgi:hypothetical protein